MAETSATRITILISGSGTNLQALIDAWADGRLEGPVDIVKVIYNRKHAFGRQRAERAGIPTTYHNLRAYKDRLPVDDARLDYDKDLAQLILQDRPDLVVCAGWMHIFSEACLIPLERQHVSIINLHPALPGQFNGADAIKRAHQEFLAHRISSTGIMIHNVIAAVDEGEPLLVREIPLEHPRDDDLPTLEQRVHETEWKAIVEGTNVAIRQLWEKRSAQSDEHNERHATDPAQTSSPQRG